MCGVPWWLSRLRIWCCHCCASGYRCGMGLISGLGSSACHVCSPPKNPNVLYLQALKIIVISPMYHLIWVNCHLTHDNMQQMCECLFCLSTLLRPGETILDKSLTPRNSQSSGWRSKKTLVLIKNYARKSTICYTNVIETRFLDVGHSQFPFYPRPKEKCGLCLFCFTSSPIH